MIKDKYVYGMDWATNEVKGYLAFNNYRKYQYNLISKFIGKSILEVGSGDRSFTYQILCNNKDIERIISIEPSETLNQLGKDNFLFPKKVEFHQLDLFNITPLDFGLFDSIVFIHVLEHIENDSAALNHAYDLLKPGGCILIEVPALQCLYSQHDNMLGHFRRYTKKYLESIINTDRYKIDKMFYNDPIGVLGSFYYFKIKGIQLKSDEGLNLVKKQGSIYDRFIIPFEQIVEKLITFPFGLNLTAILTKK